MVRWAHLLLVDFGSILRGGWDCRLFWFVSASHGEWNAACREAGGEQRVLCCLLVRSGCELLQYCAKYVLLKYNIR